MAWKVTDVVDERLKFMLEARAKQMSFKDLCAKYGISRKTGYKWCERYEEDPSPRSLFDRSRRPKSSPLRTSPEMVIEVVRLRLLYPYWGPMKLRTLLLREFQESEVPSERTVARILDTSGLVEVRRKVRGKVPGRIKQAIEVKQPNDLWTIDFKGWWQTRDQKKCEPFTLRDDWSKFFLSIQGMTSTRGELVREVMTDVFRERGLPYCIRSDNGPPFACQSGILGLTKLSAWWLALGIQLHRIDPGHPQQNGSHERPHRDIKQQIQWRPAEDLQRQQLRIDDWRYEFNHIRPHQSLGMKTPAEVYTPSPRKFPEGPLEVTYPEDFQTRRVNNKGFVKYRGRERFLSEALSGWDVGLQLHEESIRVWFAGLLLGQTDRDWDARIRSVIE